MILKSESIAKIAPALLAAQREIGAATKGSTNPFYKCNYADLGSVIEAIKAPLNSQGIAFLQAIGGGLEEFAAVETMLMHESGEYISFCTPILCAKQNDAQSFGSGSTYAKRYALQAIMGLPTADDDGEDAMDRKGKKPTKGKPGKAKTGKGPTNLAENIMDQAFFEYDLTHSNSKADGWKWDRDLFDQAVKDHFGGLPTNKASIKKICDEIPADKILSEVIVDAKE